MWLHKMKTAHCVRVVPHEDLRCWGSEDKVAGGGVGGFMGLCPWQLWLSCLGFLCPRGPGWGRKQSSGLLQLWPQPMPDLLPLVPPGSQ